VILRILHLLVRPRSLHYGKRRSRSTHFFFIWLIGWIG
jgi:hypothetical protein